MSRVHSACFAGRLVDAGLQIAEFDTVFFLPHAGVVNSIYSEYTFWTCSILTPPGPSDCPFPSTIVHVARFDLTHYFPDASLAILRESGRASSYCCCMARTTCSARAGISLLHDSTVAPSIRLALRCRQARSDPEQCNNNVSMRMG